MQDQITRLLPGVPSVESPFFSHIFSDPSIDDEIRRIAHDFNQNGFAVLDFPDDDFDRIADSIKVALNENFPWQDWLDFGFEKNNGLRAINAWKFDENVKRLATNARIIEILTTLFGRQAWPFQTLNFPVGTQQHVHTDSVHFSSVPERFMCGVWTALEAHKCVTPRVTNWTNRMRSSPSAMQPVIVTTITSILKNENLRSGSVLTACPAKNLLCPKKC